MLRYFLILILSFVAPALSFAQGGGEVSAKEIIQKAMDNWRGLNSYSEMTMVIHRDNWERAMSMKAWTEGEKRSLVRVTKPKKDKGNATLVLDNEMWSFSPKINRVIKIPSSMMNQSWMGSDFSNRDVSRTTEILDRYIHTLKNTEVREGHTIYTIVSIPKEDAPVVWGKEILQIRDDDVMLQHEFWDQDGVLIKKMETTEIKEMGGRTIAASMRMYKIESPDEWTSMRHEHIQFEVDLPKQLFTLSNLRNPRQ